MITPADVNDRLRGTFPGDMGFEVLEVSAEGARGRLTVDQRHLHPGGAVHGGVWVGFADTVAAWATIANLPPGHDFSTAELKANVVAAAGPGDELLATARPVHVGRRTQVWEVRIEVGGRLAALFVCTQVVTAREGGFAR